MMRNKDQKEYIVTNENPKNQAADFFLIVKHLKVDAESHDDIISHNLFSLNLPRNKSFPYLILAIKYIMVCEKLIMYQK